MSETACNYDPAATRDNGACATLDASVLAGTVIYGGVGGNEFAYGSKGTKHGMSLTNCARSFKKNLIEGNEPAQSDTSEADR